MFFIQKKPLVTFTLLALLLSACGTQEIYLCKDGSLAGDQQITSDKVIFHCADGKKTNVYDKCSFEKPLTITQKLAEQKSLAFVQGYSQANGWSAKLINVYAQNGDWYSQIVLSKRDESSFETIVKIDGIKGIASCEENCKYQS